MTSPDDITDDLDLPTPDEIAAAVRHLSQYDPASYLQAIAAMIADDDDRAEVLTGLVSGEVSAFEGPWSERRAAA